MTKVAVLGSGSWGTAYAKVLADAGSEVMLWARRPEVATSVNRYQENPDYLPGVTLPVTLKATADFRQALDGARIVVLAIPSQTLRPNLDDWRDSIGPDATLVSLM